MRNRDNDWLDWVLKRKKKRDKVELHEIRGKLSMKTVIGKSSKPHTRY
jgi:hypothetical protein